MAFTVTFYLVVAFTMQELDFPVPRPFSLSPLTRYGPNRPAADMENLNFGGFLRIFGDLLEDFWSIFEEFWRIWLVVRKRLRSSINGSPTVRC